jgi:hypothetical protein
VKRSDSDFVCSVCSKRVDLRTVNTDDDGKTVHGECYVALIVLKDAVRAFLIQMQCPIAV